MVKDIISKDFGVQFQIGSGTVSIVQQPENKSEAEGAAILTEQTTFAISDYTGGAINVSKSGYLASFTFTPTAIYTKHQGKKVLLDEDKATVTITGSNSSTGTVTQVDVVTIKAKQHTVKGS